MCLWLIENAFYLRDIPFLQNTGPYRNENLSFRKSHEGKKPVLLLHSVARYFFLAIFFMAA